MLAILGMVLMMLSFNVSAQTGLVPWTGDTASAFAGGSGTEEDPYLITSGSHLALLAKEYNARKSDDPTVKYYRLENDIDLGGALPEAERPNYNSIGYAIGIKGFDGVFDGNGKKIYNLYQYAPTKNYGGVFGGIQADGVVKNLTLASGEITMKTYAGGIVGASKGIIENCHNYADVTGTNTSNVYVGGITGNVNGGKVRNCTNHGSVQAKDYAGGIAGNVQAWTSPTVPPLSAGEVSGCVNYGSVRGNSWTGGLVGKAAGSLPKGATEPLKGLVDQCVNLGPVALLDATTPLSNIGGLVGLAANYAHISNCANLGRIEVGASVAKMDQIACVVGSASSGATIENCLSAGSVYVLGEIAAVTAKPENVTLRNIYITICSFPARRRLF